MIHKGPASWCNNLVIFNLNKVNKVTKTKKLKSIVWIRSLPHTRIQIPIFCNRWETGWTLNHDVQQISLLSHLQFAGSFRHIGQIIVPHPTQVLSALLQAQWLHVLLFNFAFIYLPHDIKSLELIICAQSANWTICPVFL